MRRRKSIRSLRTILFLSISKFQEILIRSIAGSYLLIRSSKFWRRKILGEVTGGGSLSVPDEDGDYEDEFSGIDVHLYDAIKGPPLLRGELVRLQAPSGTVLLYEIDGKEWEEPVYSMKN